MHVWKTRKWKTWAFTKSFYSITLAVLIYTVSKTSLSGNPSIYTNNIILEMTHDLLPAYTVYPTERDHMQHVIFKDCYVLYDSFLQLYSVIFIHVLTNIYAAIGLNV